MQESANPDITSEDHRKHLEFIQAIITRMASASVHAKSWLLPVVTAAYGFALTQRSGSIAILGLVAVALFAYVDAQYLKSERQYRKLYLHVVNDRKSIPLYSLDPKQAQAIEAENAVSKWGTLFRDWWPGRYQLLSWSVAPFYGVQFLVGVCVLIRTLTL